MKQIEKVSIGCYAFTLDDQAADACRSYLGELENHYNGTSGGREILDGIEERMAELLLDRAGADTVVTAPTIEAVIAILGRPEDIEEGDSPDEPANDEEVRSYSVVVKYGQRTSSTGSFCRGSYRVRYSGYT